MATAENATKFNVSVPLGDKDHPNEEKGTTKVVRRVLTNLKGSAPKRTGVVFWRKEHFAVAESSENPGHFDVTGKAKKSDVPTEQAPVAKKAGVRKVQAKGSTRKTAAKSSAKEADRRRRAA